MLGLHSRLQKLVIFLLVALKQLLEADALLGRSLVFSV